MSDPKTALIILLIYVIIGIVLSAENKNNLYIQKIVTGGGNEYYIDAVKSGDGFTAFGYTIKYDPISKADAMISKFDNDGEMTWTKTFGNEDEQEHGYSISTTSDSGYVTAGDTCAYDGDGDAMNFVAKLDSSGEIEFFVYFGDDHWDMAYSVIEITGGDFVVTGVTDRFGSFCSDLFIARLDSAGVLQWDKAISVEDGSCVEMSWSLIETSTGSLLSVSGSSHTPGFGDLIIVTSLDMDGNVEWFKSYGNSSVGEEQPFGVVEMSDGCFLISGSTGSYGAGGIDGLLLKIDSVGNIVWAKTFGSVTGDEFFGSLVMTSNGDVAVFGSIENYFEYTATFLSLFDSNGTMRWTRLFNHSSKNDKVRKGIIETDNGDFVMSGNVMADDFVTDHLVMKVNKDGYIPGCDLISDFTDHMIMSDWTDEIEGIERTPDEDVLGWTTTEAVISSTIRNPIQVINCSSVECSMNYFGEFCNLTECNGIFSNDSDVCNKRGECVEYDTCECIPEFIYSPKCDVYKCGGLLSNESMCDGNGTCTEPNGNCNCTEYFYGLQCEVFECAGELTNTTQCNGHGHCLIPGGTDCVCDEGWTGQKCSNCEEYYFGTNCTVIECAGQLSNLTEEKICYGHGTCNVPGGIECNCTTTSTSSEYFGKLCDWYICANRLTQWDNSSSSICNNHGTCLVSQDDQCNCSDTFIGTHCESCIPLYYGSDCGIFICADQFSNSSERCNGHGSCHVPGRDYCHCEEGFGGRLCNLDIFDMNDSLIFTKIFSGSNQEQISSGKLARDKNSFIIAGGIDLFGYSTKAFIAKFQSVNQEEEEEGSIFELEWIRVFGNSTRFQFLAKDVIEISSDQGYIVVGTQIINDDESSSQCFIARFTQNGELSWMNIPFSNNLLELVDYELNKVIETTDSLHYIAVGSSNKGAMITKFDENGNIVFWKVFGDRGVGRSVIQSRIGHYYLTGSIVSEAYDVFDGGLFVSKIQDDGKLDWIKVIGNSGFDEGIDIIEEQTLEGYILILGVNEDCVDCSYLLKLDAQNNGRLIWSIRFEFGEEEEVRFEKLQEIVSAEGILKYGLGGTVQKGGGDGRKYGLLGIVDENGVWENGKLIDVTDSSITDFSVNFLDYSEDKFFVVGERIVTSFNTFLNDDDDDDDICDLTLLDFTIFSQDDFEWDVQLETTYNFSLSYIDVNAYNMIYSSLEVFQINETLFSEFDMILECPNNGNENDDDDSDEDDDDDDDDDDATTEESLETWELVGIILGAVLGILICCCFVISLLLLFLLGVFVVMSFFIGCSILTFFPMKYVIKKSSNTESKKTISGHSDSAKIDFNPKLFEIKYKNIKILSQIGSGGSSAIVYKAKWKRKIVAFKCFRISPTVSNSRSKFREFENEAEILLNVRHPNILHCFGCSMKIPRVGIVMEYCENGDLHYYFEEYGDNLDCFERLRIISGISHAMEYLHSLSIMHRDLKPQNVLLDDCLVPKLMDFGLTRLIQNTQQSKTRGIGTPYFMAPEVVKGKRYNKLCDVFSFSVLVWMLMNNDFYPYDDEESYALHVKVANNPSFRPSVTMEESDINFPLWVQRMCIECWDNDPKNRMSFEQISELLTKKLDKMENDEVSNSGSSRSNSSFDEQQETNYRKKKEEIDDSTSDDEKSLSESEEEEQEKGSTEEEEEFDTESEEEEKEQQQEEDEENISDASDLSNSKSDDSSSDQSSD